MVRNRKSVLVGVIALVGCAALPGAAAARTATQTLVFDALVHNRFVDRPPIGRPSPGDTEVASGTLRDATGRVVGTASDTCVFTKVIPNDVLEHCSGRARTTDGAVTLAGVGHLYSMNPPWQVTGQSGAYKGLHGTQVFASDIPIDPNVPLAAGRLYSVAVIVVRTNRRLHAGVVPRPAANGTFIGRANALCRAAEAKGQKLPPFPYTTFDPFHPDRSRLPDVGRFFDQPARRALPAGLIRGLAKLGQPPAARAHWHDVLAARRTMFSNETAQITAALASDVPGFVRTVYQQATAYNRVVFSSAVFGVESCTFA